MASNVDQQPLLVVSPNLAVDHLIDARSLRIGHVQRVDRRLMSAGGKGVNVARAAGCLNMAAIVVGLLSGNTGQLFRTLLRDENTEIKVDAIESSGETRIATLIYDHENGQTTVLNENGPAVDQIVRRQLVNRVTAATPNASAVAFTGSLQPGINPSLYSELIEHCNKERVTSLVDAAGEGLEAAIQARPTVAKINFDEAASLYGADFDAAEPNAIERHAIRLATELRDHGATTGIVTVGPLGAALATTSGGQFFYAPKVKAQNAVGAGDAFLAAYAMSLQSNKTAPESCRFAIAASASSVQSTQPGHVTPSLIPSLAVNIREFLQ